MVGQRGGGRTVGWWSAAALVFVVTIAASRLFDPFSGDQALFLVGAKTLHDGGVLYRDYWDIKQPGIFAFFLTAGMLFGFTQTGAHAFDLLWQIAFSVALVAALRRVLDDGRWAAFAPLGVVGATYAGSSAWHLLQVEELVGFPLFVCIWAVCSANRNPRGKTRFVLASGIAAGVVLLFKLLLAPVVAAVTIAAAFRARARCSIGVAARFWTLWTFGMLVPFAIYAAYAVATGSLNVAIETAVVIPVRIAAHAPHAPLTRLGDSALRLLLYFRGLIVLAAIGALTIRKQRMRPLRAACVAWLASGVAVILIQAQSWWQYQFILLVPPLGILATFGAAFLGGRVAIGGRGGFVALAASGIVAYVAVPLPQGAAGTLLRVLRERPYASAAALERYRVMTSTEYAAAAVDAALPERLAPDSGPIYVFGNPLVYVLAHRTAAAAVTSWASYLDPPIIWARLDSELSAARPSYIFTLNDPKRRRFLRSLPQDSGDAIARLCRNRTNRRRHLVWKASPDLSVENGMAFVRSHWRSGFVSSYRLDRDYTTPLYVNAGVASQIVNISERRVEVDRTPSGLERASYLRRD